MPSIHVFQCIQCREYIASDAKTCRFCGAPVDEGVAQEAVVKQLIENRKYRRRQYAKHMLIGSGLFVAGLAITIVTYIVAAVSEGGGHFLVTWGLMFSGAADFIYGTVGLLSELKAP